MNDVIVTIVGLAIVGGALLALQHWLANAARYRAEMTEEDYEESRQQSAGMMGNGLMSLDQMLRPETRKAMEYRIAAEQGQLPGGGGQGEMLPPLDDDDDADDDDDNDDDDSPPTKATIQ